MPCRPEPVRAIPTFLPQPELEPVTAEWFVKELAAA